MYSHDDLESAIAAGVLSRQTADAFRAHASARHRASDADQEHVRLITGFNDVFVVIASALLLLAVHLIMAEWSLWLAVAATSWGLAEQFERLGAVGFAFALTALAIGAALLLLSAFWQASRVWVVGRLPPALTAQLPPLR